MQNILIKMGLAILTKLITEKFLSRIFVHTGWYLAQKTKNKLDDKIVGTCAKALDVKDYK